MICALLCGLFYGWLAGDAWRKEAERREYERAQEQEREWCCTDAELPEFITGTSDEPEAYRYTYIGDWPFPSPTYRDPCTCKGT